MQHYDIFEFDKNISFFNNDTKIDSEKVINNVESNILINKEKQKINKEKHILNEKKRRRLISDQVTKMRNVLNEHNLSKAKILELGIDEIIKLRKINEELKEKINNYITKK